MAFFGPSQQTLVPSTPSQLNIEQETNMKVVLHMFAPCFHFQQFSTFNDNQETILRSHDRFIPIKRFVNISSFEMERIPDHPLSRGGKQITHLSPLYYIIVLSVIDMIADGKYVMRKK